MQTQETGLLLLPMSTSMFYVVLPRGRPKQVRLSGWIPTPYLPTRLLSRFVLSAYLWGHPPIPGSQSLLFALLSGSNLEGRLGTPFLHSRVSRQIWCQCELVCERVAQAHTNLFRSKHCLLPAGRKGFGKMAYLIIREAEGR